MVRLTCGSAEVAALLQVGDEIDLAELPAQRGPRDGTGGGRIEAYEPAEAEGRPREVFARGPKEGTDLSHTLHDACVIISVALQSGVPGPALAKNLGRAPAWSDGREGTGPASIIGAVLAVVITEGARV